VDSPYSASPYGYYDWTSDYGTTMPGFENSPVSEFLRRQNFQIAYDYATRGAGLRPGGSFANFVRSQQDLVQRAFNQAMMKNPALQGDPSVFINQYMGGPNGMAAMQQQFNALPYQLRGEDPTRWGQGTARWVPRNN
jgi:hypothetical protein